MSDCCTPKGYRQIFSEKNAAGEARRYRHKALDGTSKRILDVVKQRGVAGRSLLEVGGGIGAIEIELLKAGMAKAVNVELTPTYEAVAGELIGEAGLSDRVSRMVMDFAAAGPEVSSADVVVMNRVICCYHDMPKLAGEAADRAKDMLVLSFPNRRWWTRVGLAVANLAFRIVGCSSTFSSTRRRRSWLRSSAAASRPCSTSPASSGRWSRSRRPVEWSFVE